MIKILWLFSRFVLFYFLQRYHFPDNLLEDARRALRQASFLNSIRFESAKGNMHVGHYKDTHFRQFSDSINILFYLFAPTRSGEAFASPP